jgi:hypothetical protein
MSLSYGQLAVLPADVKMAVNIRHHHPMLASWPPASQSRARRSLDEQAVLKEWLNGIIGPSHIIMHGRIFP